MRTRIRRWAVTAGLICGGGFLMAGPGTSCVSFIGETALTAIDSSFIFDCTDAVGGTVDLDTFLLDCSPPEQ